MPELPDDFESDDEEEPDELDELDGLDVPDEVEGFDSEEVEDFAAAGELLDEELRLSFR